MSFSLNPTKRFSNRVADYIKYRPGYPSGVLQCLKEECQLQETSIVADIGAGTGILTEVFLKNGNLVVGVEPNREMREAAQNLLSEYAYHRSIDGSAEATNLDGSSVDFVTAGQAFHWFEMDLASHEFARILKPNGWVVLIWNDRLIDSTSFLKAYEELLLTYALDYRAVDHKNIGEEAIGRFFGHDEFRLQRFENRQTFDFQGLKGRLLSSSYAPTQVHPNYQPMIQSLKRMFDGYQTGGEVTFEYETKMFFGRMT